MSSTVQRVGQITPETPWRKSVRVALPASTTVLAALRRQLLPRELSEGGGPRPGEASGNGRRGDSFGKWPVQGWEDVVCPWLGSYH